MHERENALNQWLVTLLPDKAYELNSLCSDASFRRYFRLQYDGLSRVVMDAPPAKESLEPFIQVAQTLSQFGVPTPEILAQDQQQGFLLLGDFGDQLLLHSLTKDNADLYYKKAITTLLKIQTCSTAGLAAFDHAFMLKEMNLCNEWFFEAYLNLNLNINEQELVQNTMQWIAAELAQQAQVFIHRDYHSRNLMLIENNALGVIDFQDAMRGPITYDLVSLLKDCYISWPRAKVLAWIEFFYNNNPLAQTQSLSEFIRAFDLCGIQRHLKVLGVFGRLKLRDNKNGYIKDLPLTLKYVLDCAESYTELRPLFELIQKRVYLP
ncbi:MAG: phosphotransferase [Legionella sp.]|jgi:hypothetical protein